MEHRPLEITVMSADDLKNVNLISKMDVYVVVSVPTAKRQRTPVDKHGGRSPAWKHRLKFSVAESVLSPDHYPTNLTFKIKSKRLLGDREIGEVVVPVKQLLHDYTSSAPVSGDCPPDRTVDYQIRSTSGKPKGSLKFSYKFGEKIPAQQTETKNLTKDDLPVTAYPLPPGTGYPTAPPPPMTAPPYGNPAPPYGNLASPTTPPYGNPAPGYPGSGGAGYPPQQPGYGYPAPLPGYGYPPAPAYGYQPQPQAAYGSHGHGAAVGQQRKGKKKGGGKMGMGLGLGAGLLGGMVLGDMMSDAAEMTVYDA